VKRKVSIILAVTVTIFIVVLVGGALFLKSEYAANRMCHVLQSSLEKKLGLTTTIKSCSLELLPPTLEGQHLLVQAIDGDQLLAVEKLRVELDSINMLAGRLRVNRVRIERPEVHLKMDNGKIVGLPLMQDSADTKAPSSAKAIIPERIEVVDSRIDILDAQYGLLTLKDINARLASSDESEAQLVGEISKGSVDLAGGYAKTLSFGDIKFKVNIVQNKIELDRFKLRVEDYYLEAQGTIERKAEKYVPDIDFNLAGRLDGLAEFWEEFPSDVKGDLGLSVKLASKDDSIYLDGKIKIDDGQIAQIDKVRLASDLGLTTQGVRLSKLSLTWPAGKLAGDLSLYFDESLKFEGKLKVHEIKLKELLARLGIGESVAAYQGSADLTISGALRGTSGPFVQISSKADIGNLAFYSSANKTSILELSKGKVELDATVDQNHARFNSFVLKIDQSQLVGRGLIDFAKGTFLASLSTSFMQLGDFSPVAGIDLRGVCNLEADIEGTFASPKIETKVKIENLVLANRSLGTFLGNVAYRDQKLNFKKMTLDRRGQKLLASGEVATVFPYPIDFSMELGEVEIVDLVGLLRGRPTDIISGGIVGGFVETKGTLDAPILDVKVAFRDLLIDGQLFQEGGMIGRMENWAWNINLFEARLGTGWLFLQGHISEKLHLDLTAYSTGLRASSFKMLDAWKQLVDFRVDFNLSAKGPLRSPSFAGWMKIYDTLIYNQSAPNSFIAAKATTKSVLINGRFLGNAVTVAGRAELKRDLPFSAKVKFGSSHLASFLPYRLFSKTAVAEAFGDLTASGKLLEPRQIDGRLLINRFSLKTSNLHLENKLPIFIAVQGGSFKVKQCDLVGKDTLLSVRGSGDFNGPLLSAVGKINLNLVPLLVDYIPRAVGSAELGLFIGGSWLKPELTGSSTFSASLVRVQEVKQDFRQVSGDLQFSRNVVDLSRIRGQYGGGSFIGQGRVDLDDFAYRKLALNLEVDKVRYYVERNLWGVCTGVLLLQGAHDKRLKLSGKVRVLEGAYVEHIPIVSFDEGLFIRRLGDVPTYDEKNEIIGFDLAIQSSGGFKIVYNLDLIDFESKVQGEVRITGTNERLGLLGEAEALEGEGVVTYLTKGFSIQAARVRFVEELSIHPQVEASASLLETVDRGNEGKTDYQIDLKLTADGSQQPRISLKSSPPLPESDIVMLLHFGFTSQDMDVKSEDLVGLGGEVLFRTFRLDKRLRQVFPFPPDVIQAKYLRLRSRYNSTYNTVTPHIEVGLKLRFLSDKLDLQYGRSIVDVDDQNLELTYELSERISTRLQWDNQERDKSIVDIGDLGVDLSFHWEW
jgi:hypothetical protein